MEKGLSKNEIKRLEEINLFKQFLKLSGIGVSSYNQPKSDPPDIEGTIGNKTFSMEITKLFNKSGEKLIQYQKLIDRITEKLNSKSESNIINNFGVLYELRKGIKINLSEEDNLIDIMIKIVQRKIDAEPNKDYYGLNIDKNELPSEIAKFELRRFPEIKGKKWYTRKSWMVGRISDSIILENITTKIQSALKNGYFNQYDQNWLLLVVENEPHSDFSEYLINLDKIDNNVFDRAYIMEKVSNKIIEVEFV